MGHQISLSQLFLLRCYLEMNPFCSVWIVVRIHSLHLEIPVEVYTVLVLLRGWMQGVKTLPQRGLDEGEQKNNGEVGKGKKKKKSPCTHFSFGFRPPIRRLTCLQASVEHINKQRSLALEYSPGPQIILAETDPRLKLASISPCT